MGLNFSRNRYSQRAQLEEFCQCVNEEKCEKLPENPGTYNDYNRSYKDLIPAYFVGVQIDLCKVLSNHLQVSHSFLINNSAQNYYKFGVEYLGNERNPRVFGIVNSSGILSGGLSYQLGPFTSRMLSRLKSTECDCLQFGIDHRSCDGTSTLNVSEIDFFDQNFKYSFQNLRRLTTNCLIGFEFSGLYRWDSVELNYEFNCLAKYMIDNGYVCGKFSRKEMQLNYYQEASDRMRFGAEFYRNFDNSDTNATFAYQFTLKEDAFLYKAYLGTNGIIGGTIEKKLRPLDYTLVFGAQTNYFKEHFSIGVGFRVGDC